MTIAIIRDRFKGYPYKKQLIIYKLALKYEHYELLKILNSAIPVHTRSKFLADVQALKLPPDK